VTAPASHAGRSAAEHGADALGLHSSCLFVYLESVERETYRVNVTLGGEHAAKLRRLSERTHVQEGTLARSLLAGALDDADPDARNVAELLDSIDGAYERAQLGLEQARASQTVSLDDL